MALEHMEYGPMVSTTTMGAPWLRSHGLCPEDVMLLSVSTLLTVTTSLLI